MRKIEQALSTLHYFWEKKALVYLSFLHYVGILSIPQMNFLRRYQDKHIRRTEGLGRRFHEPCLNMSWSYSIKNPIYRAWDNVRSTGTTGSFRSATKQGQSERHKFACLISKPKKKSFARLARAFFICVHFVPVVGKSTTCNDQISSFTKNVNTQRRILIFSAPFLVFRSWISWNNDATVSKTWICNLKRCFHWLRRRRSKSL